MSDLYTDSLANEIISFCSENLRPSAVISGISRNKVDLNDRPEIDYKGDGKGIFDSFHNSIVELYMDANKKNERVLIVDLHGFAHRDIHPAFGCDVILGTANGKSMPINGNKCLTRAFISDYLSTNGWSVYPEKEEPETIFPGGYIIRKHCHIEEGRTGIQVEISSRVRKSNTKRLMFANTLANLIQILSQ